MIETAAGDANLWNHHQYLANNGEALHYHGKMFNHLADVQPISKEVYPDDDE